MSRFIWVVSLIVGAAAVVGVVWWVGPDTCYRTLRGIGVAGLALFLLNSTLIMIAPAAGWWLLMRGDGIRIPFLPTLRAQWMGYPVNLTTPSMYLGGDALRTFYVAHITGIPKRRALATIVVSRFQEFTGWFFGFIAGTVLLISTTDVLQRSTENVLAIVCAAAVFLYGIVFYSLAGRFRLTVKVIHLLARLRFLRRRMAKLRHHADEMEERIHAAFTQRKVVYAASQALALVSAFSVFIRPWIFAAFLPREMASYELLLTMTVLTSLVNMAGIVPGGLGIFEGAMAWKGKEIGVAYAIVNRLSDAMLFAVGTWMIFHSGLKRFFKAAPVVEEPPGA